ncbi:MAG: chorismate-binding protein [Cyclobacteriaceae bacterium]|jgi:isochorismate synthase
MRVTEDQQRVYVQHKALTRVLGHHVKQGHSFSMWRMPEHHDVFLLVSTSGARMLDTLEIENLKPGFAIAPFLPNRPKYFLEADYLYRFTHEEQLVHGPYGWEKKEVPFSEDQDNNALPALHYHNQTTSFAADYRELVARAVEQIKQGVLEKVVPARKQIVEFSGPQDWPAVFFKLADRYPHALVTLCSTPETGTWIGATPELLISQNASDQFKTVALAGTKPFDAGTDLKAVAWTEKEIEEQAMVSRYIINCFKKIRVREFDEQGPRTVQAGNLLHLKTEFTVDTRAINFPQLASVMLNLLHPTSAVCGMPLHEALQFLSAYEGMDRELYGGYWGPVNVDSETQLFVNLRCMKVSENVATLFAGAGVTHDSIPEAEWKETGWKMNTLLNVIQS